MCRRYNDVPVELEWRGIKTTSRTAEVRRLRVKNHGVMDQGLRVA